MTFVFTELKCFDLAIFSIFKQNSCGVHPSVTPMFVSLKLYIQKNEASDPFRWSLIFICADNIRMFIFHNFIFSVECNAFLLLSAIKLDFVECLEVMWEKEANKHAM